MGLSPQNPQLLNLFLRYQFWLSHAIIRILSYSVNLRIHVWVQDWPARKLPVIESYSRLKARIFHYSHVALILIDIK